jgi:carbonic anhydrase
MGPSRLGVAVIAVLGVAACSGSSEDQSDLDYQRTVHWSYEGEDGPQHWGNLSPDYAPCKEGKEQSPVDLGSAVEISGTPLERSYQPARLSMSHQQHAADLLDNGHTIQIDWAKGSTVTLDRVEFELVQLHFHAPSEHTVDGRHYPLEIHYVHASPDGKLAVVGLFVEEGQHDPLMDPVIENLPSRPGETRHVEGVVYSVSEMFPGRDHYYEYMGSLTTPPCSEGVRWVILAEPIEASADQISAVASRIAENNRPVQSLGSRQVGVIAP